MTGSNRTGRLRAANTRVLHLALADASSGTPRQWWHLELARAAGDDTPADAWAGALARLVRLSRPSRFVPVLHLLGLAGLRPYQVSLPPDASRRALQAAQLGLSLFAALCGMNVLNATRQFILLSTVILAASYMGLRGFLAARRLRQTVQMAQDQLTEALTPSEQALGLTGLIVASGVDYDLARERTQAMLRQPDKIEADWLQSLGMLHPARIGDLLGGLQQAGYGALGGAAVIWPCWATRHPGQLAAGWLGYLLCCFVLYGTSTRFRQASLRGTILAAGSLIIGVLLRYRLQF